MRTLKTHLKSKYNILNITHLGYSAYDFGLGRADNPFPIASKEAQQWKHGYNLAIRVEVNNRKAYE